MKWTDTELVDLVVNRRDLPIAEFREYVAAIIALVRMNESLKETIKSRDELSLVVERLQSALIPQPEEEL